MLAPQGAGDAHQPLATRQVAQKLIWPRLACLVAIGRGTKVSQPASFARLGDHRERFKHQTIIETLQLRASVCRRCTRGAAMTALLYVFQHLSLEDRCRAAVVSKVPPRLASNIEAHRRSLRIRSGRGLAPRISYRPPTGLCRRNGTTRRSIRRCGRRSTCVTGRMRAPGSHACGCARMPRMSPMAHCVR